MASTNAFDRQRPPHLREPGGTYFATWRIADGQAPLSAAERDSVAAALRHFDGQRYTLHAWVVMDDHVHVVATPADGTELVTLVHSWKSFTAAAFMRQHGRFAPIWQRGYFDRLVRPGGERDEKVAYIRSNPWKRWPELSAYRWVFPGPGW